MGIMSRKVLPACGGFCIFFPKLRARSRHPVKRYKALLSNIFPKSQRLAWKLRRYKFGHAGVQELQDFPYEGKIGKLTVYALKNPLRIPKIASAIEQYGYNALKRERYSVVRVVMRIYSKLLIDCRDQMPLFAASALTMIRVLLEVEQNDSLQILACWTLVDFLDNQMDSTYMRDLDALLPYLCSLSRAKGEEFRHIPLRSAGLQALASMINFMGKFFYIPLVFDDVVAVVLDNYESSQIVGAESQDYGETQQNLTEGVLKGKCLNPVEIMKEKECGQTQDSSKLAREETKTPNVWSHIFIQNTAKLAKEASTVRRILEPMFQYFDAGEHWPPGNLALDVLCKMQHFMEKSGCEYLSFQLLVRHLDDTNVVENVQLKRGIIEVIAHLARQSNVKSTVVSVGAIADLLRHLQRSIQHCLEAPKTPETGMPSPHGSLQQFLEDCLSDLSKRVANTTVLFEMMATSLEKLSLNPVLARTMTEAVSVLAKCLINNLPKQFRTEQQVFTDSLFQQVLQVMIHPDVETRVKAHRIFALLLMPSSMAVRANDDLNGGQIWSESSTPPTSCSVVVSATELCTQLQQGKTTYEKDSHFETTKGWNKEPVFDGRRTLKTDACHGGESAVRLSGHQAALLLSTLWLQAILPDNVPSSYEAIANTYILTLAFSQAKTSRHRTVLRAFQLALSLRSLAINPSYAGIQLPPSRCRSLFTLSAAMLAISARIYGSPQLGVVARASLTSSVKDPYLELSDDIRLEIVTSRAGFVNIKDYGSAADDRDAFKSFSGVAISEEQEPEALAALIVGSCTLLGADDFAVADQLLQVLPMEEGHGFGPQFFSESPYSGELPLYPRNPLVFNEVDLLDTMDSVEGGTESESCVELPLLLSSIPDSPVIPNVMGVSQLLQAALVTAVKAPSQATSEACLSYPTVASHCETVSFHNQKKRISILKLDSESGPWQFTLSERYLKSASSMQDEWKLRSRRKILQLPPSSPYDMFLKAAGC